MNIAEKLTTIAENEKKVYEKGRTDEHKDFWSGLQNYGNKTNYVNSFYGTNWTDEIYKPIYPFVVYTNSNNMFCNTRITSTQKAIDITADTINSNTAYMFQYASLLKTITLLKLKNDGSNNLTKCFDGCESLTTITIEGTIGRDVSFADSPLTVESMKGVISHLKNYAETDPDNKGKHTIIFHSDCWDALEVSGTAEDGGTWKDYVTKLGWLYA